MAPAQVAGMFAHVAEQAKGEGLNYRFDDVVVANSFTAHRLIHLAAAHGQQDAAKERLLSDHFERGKDIGSREYLTSLGLDLGSTPPKWTNCSPPTSTPTTSGWTSRKAARWASAASRSS